MSRYFDKQLPTYAGKYPRRAHISEVRVIRECSLNVYFKKINKYFLGADANEMCCTCLWRQTVDFIP